MGINRTHIAKTDGHHRPQASRPPANAQRHLMDSAHGSPLAGFARAIWALAERLRLLSKLAKRRDLRSDASGPASSSGSRGQNRLGFMVHRRLLRAGISGSSWGFKKSLRQHPEEPEDHALGRSRGGFGSKFHLVTDGRGLPLAVEVTAGQRHESTQLQTVLEAIAVPQPVGRPRKRPARLAGDKAYSFPSVREWLRAHGIEPIIPIRSNQKKQHGAFDKQSYRRRCVIEQCVGWLKECRRIATRFEKLAVSFLAMFKLAMIQRYLKIAFSDTA